MGATDRKTRAAGILTLSGVPVIKAGEEVTHYQIHPEGGWLAAANIQKVSQYSFGELGFVTLDKAPESFDLIDGIKHPDNVVKGILAQMYKAAQDETRTSHALNEYNHKLDSRVVMFKKISFLIFLLFSFYTSAEQIVVQGPYLLKGAMNSSIEFVKNSDKSISLQEMGYGISKSIDIYEVGGGVPKIETVFFDQIKNKRKLIVFSFIG